jgi:hypothetical protein
VFSENGLEEKNIYGGDNMKNSISEKQLKANRKNAKKGGVKTSEGKEISKYNALKHGVLSGVITEYDKGNFEELHQRLIKEFSPEAAIEEILVERIGLYIIRLNHASEAETEYLMKILDPEVNHYEGGMDLELEKWVVDKPGYKPKIRKEDVESLENLYLRYEKSLENRLYRTLHEHERIQRARKGDRIPPQISVDIGTESN